MPGPTTPEEALLWVKEAMNTGNYRNHPHFDRRCRERGATVLDAKRIVATATSCVGYEAVRLFEDGTAWRIEGTDTDGAAAQLGVEAFRDHLGRKVLLITIVDGG